MSQRRRRVPDRTYIGPRPEPSHPAEFNPSPLPDEPEFTVLLVVVAVIVALLVVLVGSNLHAPATISLQIINGLCPNGAVPNTQGIACPSPTLSFWNRLPMTVWFVYAVLAAGLVVIAPFLVYRVKPKTGQL